MFASFQCPSKLPTIESLIKCYLCTSHILAWAHLIGQHEYFTNTTLYGLWSAIKCISATRTHLRNNLMRFFCFTYTNLFDRPTGPLKNGSG